MLLAVRIIYIRVALLTARMAILWAFIIDRVLDWSPIVFAIAASSMRIV